jgi:hypothetical protein
MTWFDERLFRDIPGTGLSWIRRLEDAHRFLYIMQY